MQWRLPKPLRIMFDSNSVKERRSDLEAYRKQMCCKHWNGLLNKNSPSENMSTRCAHEAKVISHRKCIIFNAITIIRQFGKLSSAQTFLKEINVAGVSASQWVQSRFEFTFEPYWIILFLRYLRNSQILSD